jgi:hypothetical protein
MVKTMKKGVYGCLEMIENRKGRSRKNVLKKRRIVLCVHFTFNYSFKHLPISSRSCINTTTMSMDEQRCLSTNNSRNRIQFRWKYKDDRKELPFVVVERVMSSCYFRRGW